MPNKRDPDKRQINVWMHAEIYDQVRRRAEKRGCPASHVIIEILEKELKRQKPARGRRRSAGKDRG